MGPRLFLYALCLAACAWHVEPSRADGGAAAAPDASVTEDAGTCAAQQWPGPPGCTATDLEGRLRCIPNLQFTQSTATPPSGYTQYELTIRQPVDHDQPDGGTFGQRLHLLHRSFAAPLVLTTTGYDLGRGRSELTRSFEANQLSYEHRYFVDSRPVPTDWSKLTIRQAAADAHRLAMIFRWLYPGPWIGTGVSKGGMTSVYHRRFHPCDVDATVAYVAPVSQGPADPAYNDFLEQVGGAPWMNCRVLLADLQKRLLTKRDQLTPLIAGDYTRIGGVDKAFELAVIELNFAFWQYTAPSDVKYGCSAIPLGGSTDAQLLDFLEHHSPVQSLGGTGLLEEFEPYYYQAATQLGAPAPFEAHLSGLLRFPGANVAATFAPPGVPIPFDAQAMADVNQWMAAAGDRVMLVYGELDPWSTRSFDFGARDGLKLLMLGGNHSARLGLLPMTQKKTATHTLERWLGISIVFAPFLRPAPLDEPERRYPR